MDISPNAASPVPSGIDEVSPQWLASVFDGATVAGARAERIAEDTGFSSLLYRVHLQGDGLPASVIVKLPAESEARGAMDMLGGYRRELTFYQQGSGRAPLATPRVHLASMNEAGDFVLVLEDLRDWTNADHLAGLTLDRTRLCIAQLAGLHAWSVGVDSGSLVEAFPSLDSPVARDLFLPVFAAGWQVYRGQTSAPIPPSVALFADRFAEHAPAALVALTERRCCCTAISAPTTCSSPGTG